MKFEPNKTYKTRSGEEALIYAVDVPGEWPIHGRIGNSSPISWAPDGSFRNDGGYSKSAHDLIPPVPERISRAVWVNALADGRYTLFVHETRERAEAAAKVSLPLSRIAVPCRLEEVPAALVRDNLECHCTSQFCTAPACRAILTAGGDGCVYRADGSGA